MRTSSSLFALFLIVCHFLSFSMTLASPVAVLELLLRRDMCYNGYCRVVEAPAVVDPFQLSSSPSSTPSSTPVSDHELGAVVTSTSESASAAGSTPTPTTTPTGSSSSSSSSKTPNAGVALVSQPKLFCAVFAALSATVLVF